MGGDNAPAENGNSLFEHGDFNASGIEIHKREGSFLRTGRCDGHQAGRTEQHPLRGKACEFKQAYLSFDHVQMGQCGQHVGLAAFQRIQDALVYHHFIQRVGDVFLGAEPHHARNFLLVMGGKCQESRCNIIAR